MLVAEMHQQNEDISVIANDFDAFHSLLGLIVSVAGTPSLHQLPHGLSEGRRDHSGVHKTVELELVPGQI